MLDVVGRDGELGSLLEFIREPDRLPRSAVLEGEAGIGKTTIWRWAVETARDRSVRVLVASPAVAEAGASFVGLADLMADVAHDVEADLAVPRRRALRVALQLEEATGRAPQPLALELAVLDALRLLARPGPLIVAIDDVQWLDAASADALAFVARRLRDEAVGFLLTVRGEMSDHPQSTLLQALPAERLRRLPLAPLSLGALHYLVLRRLDLVLSRPTLRRLHELSGGNPYFALELGRAYASGAIRLEAGEALPADLDGLVSVRIAALPHATQVALAAAAALSRPTVSLIERGLNDGDARDALGPAVAAGVIEVAGEEMRFVHPLLAAAAYAGVPPTIRADIHRRLAAVLADDEERARHLALAVEEPDEDVAATVEAAAAAAFRRGATRTAADLAAAAGRLTPEVLPDALGRRRLAEAEYRFEAGDSGTASAILEGVIAVTPAGPDRARLLSKLARFQHFAQDVGRGVTLLRQALTEAGDDPVLRAGIEEGLAWGLLLVRRDLDQAVAHARSAVAAAESVGDRALLAEALAAQGLTEFALGQSPEIAFSRALDLEEATLHLRVLRHPSFAYAYWLGCIDRPDRAREVLAELRKRAGDQGDDSALATIHNHLALVEFLAGRLDVAERYAREGYALAVQTGQRPTEASTLGKLALVQAVLGDAAARESADRALALAGGPGFDPTEPRPAMARGGESALWALGHLELSRAEPTRADRYLRPLAEALLAAGIRDPGEMRCLPDAVEALVGAGQLPAAEALLERLESCSRAVGRPSAMALAARCRGLLEAAKGSIERGLASLEEARRGLADQPLPLERARTTLALGVISRRAKHQRVARERLSEAMASFEAVGANAWAKRARDELARVGGRAAAGGLTPTEQRIAELLAEGLSTKEVALAVFVTPKTVETNVSRIYAKLGVHSRATLARALAASDTRPDRG